MNCRMVRRYLFAFADGQFDVKVNCDVLDHLKMCPSCTRIVDEHQAMRVALKRIGESIPVPSRVESMSPFGPVGRTGRSFISGWRGLAAAGVCAAACIGFAAYSAMEAFGPSPARRETVRSDRFAASRIVHVHAMCCQDWESHQDPDLPRDMEGMRVALSGRFLHQIEPAVPDLSEFGFELESVRVCGVQCGQDGVHAIYRCRETSNRCSLFSVPRIRCIESCDSEGWYEQRIEQSDKSIIYLLAWCDDKQTTHLCCSPVELDRMKEIMRPVRLAMRQP